MPQKFARRGMGAFDTNLMLRTTADGSLNTTGTYTGVAVYEAPADGFTVRISVPAAAGTGPQLICIIQAADTEVDGSYVTIAQTEGISSVGDYALRVSTQRTRIRLSAEVAGTTPDFGAVQIGVVAGGFG